MQQSSGGLKAAETAFNLNNLAINVITQHFGKYTHLISWWELNEAILGQLAAYKTYHMTAPGGAISWPPVYIAGENKIHKKHLKAAIFNPSHQIKFKFFYIVAERLSYIS